MPNPCAALTVSAINRGVSTPTCTERKRARSPHQPTGQWITRHKRLAIYIRDAFSCLYCGRDLRNAAPADITLDHLTPKSEGGSNHETNLATACRSCNSSRGARDWQTQLPGGAITRVLAQVNMPLNIELARELIAGGA